LQRITCTHLSFFGGKELELQLVDFQLKRSIGSFTTLSLHPFFTLLVRLSCNSVLAKFGVCFVEAIGEYAKLRVRCKYNLALRRNTCLEPPHLRLGFLPLQRRLPQLGLQSNFSRTQ
jgi:hypothetical protein